MTMVSETVPSRMPLIIDDAVDVEGLVTMSTATAMKTRTRVVRATSAGVGRTRRVGDAARPTSSSTMGERQSLASRNAVMTPSSTWATTNKASSATVIAQRKENSARQAAKLRRQRELEAGFDTSAVIKDTSRVVGKTSSAGKARLASGRASSSQSSSLSAPVSPKRASSARSRETSATGSGRRSATSHAKSASGAEMRSLEERLAMSQSIMRKLYHRNVELEKEVQILRAERTCAEKDASTTSATAQAGSTPSTSVLASAFEERGRTIESLREANAALQRRIGSLESALGKTGVNSKRMMQMKQSLREAAAQSVMYADQSRQIRNDYRRLLKRRADSYTQSKAALSAAVENVRGSTTTSAIAASTTPSAREAAAVATTTKSVGVSSAQMSSTSTPAIVASLRSQLDKEVRERETEGTCACNVHVCSSMCGSRKLYSPFVHTTIFLFPGFLLLGNCVDIFVTGVRVF